ncbi:MAG: hypothetical protein JXK16_13415 [Thiotrichales bacterium]|nr:hypothetical protein [Thiotrichales bacterium]
MPKIYHLRDGAPPKNVTHEAEVNTEFINENFKTSKLKFLSPINHRLPTINCENGPANQYSDPSYIIIEIQQKDIESLSLNRAGFYVVDGSRPNSY